MINLPNDPDEYDRYQEEICARVSGMWHNIIEHSIAWYNV